MDAPGRGRKPFLDPSRVETVIARVNRPPKGHARWSVRTMAEKSGVSRSSVSRIWRANDLKPKRYVWKAEGKAILGKIRRARQKLAEEFLEKPVLKTGH